MSWVFFENVSSDEKNLRMDDKKTSFFGGGERKNGRISRHSQFYDDFCMPYKIQSLLK